LRSLEGVLTVEELAQAFPVKAQLTRGLARGGYLKAAVTRWPFLSIHPHPSLKDPAARGVAVNHYKWRSDLRERLVKRYVDFTLAGVAWADESARLLDELQRHGRFRVEQWT